MRLPPRCDKRNCIRSPERNWTILLSKSGWGWHRMFFCEEHGQKVAELLREWVKTEDGGSR